MLKAPLVTDLVPVAVVLATGLMVNVKVPATAAAVRLVIVTEPLPLRKSEAQELAETPFCVNSNSPLLPA
jgi:hypothetical protein